MECYSLFTGGFQLPLFICAGYSDISFQMSMVLVESIRACWKSADWARLFPLNLPSGTRRLWYTRDMSFYVQGMFPRVGCGGRGDWIFVEISQSNKIQIKRSN